MYKGTRPMLKKYKAISLKQPWANMIASGKKTIETRKWNTTYRGDIVICSSKFPKIEPAGYALAIVELVDTRPMEKKDKEKARMKMYPKATSWILRNIRPIHPPIPVKGSLSIFEIELDLERQGRSG